MMMWSPGHFCITFSEKFPGFHVPKDPPLKFMGVLLLLKVVRMFSLSVPENHCAFKTQET